MATFQAVLLEHAHVFIVGSNSTNVAEVLYAAAWICGEFSSLVSEICLMSMRRIFRLEI